MSTVGLLVQAALQISGGESLADLISAIGTLLIVVAAVILAVAPQISGYLTRQKFNVDFKNEEPYCKTTSEGYYIRLKVVNSGKSVAKDFEGKMVRINAATKQYRKDFDPIVFTLGWLFD